MFTGVVYTDTFDNVTLADVTPLEDETIFISGKSIQVPAQFNQIAAALGLGDNLLRCQLESPKLRQIALQEVGALNTGTEPDSVTNITDLRMNPIMLQPGEAMTARVSYDDVTSAERAYVGVWLADGPVTPVTGADMRTVEGSMSVTAVANKWTSGQITLDQELPEGNYNVIGFKVNSAGSILARLIFPNQWARPMAVGSDSNTQSTTDPFRRGMSGVMGQFQNFVPPKLEVLSRSADTSTKVWLDVVKAS